MKWICPNCEYIYDEAKGHLREGWRPGTQFHEIFAEWPCPDCGVREQADFIPLPAFERNSQGSKKKGDKG